MGSPVKPDPSNTWKSLEASLADFLQYKCSAGRLDRWLLFILPAVLERKKIALPWGFSTDFYMCKSLAFYMLIGIKRETEKLKRHQDD